tara:strand:- start:637 stop:972 length:336 start_codon:yes stop_codon:yes gene_type:complete
MCYFSFSQSIDLELSQVLLLEDESTVPENKVWKIESALVNCYHSCVATILINNNYVRVYNYSTDVNNSNQKTAASGPITKFPIWVPSGTIVNLGDEVSGISVLEFNTISNE